MNFDYIDKSKNVQYLQSFIRPLILVILILALYIVALNNIRDIIEKEMLSVIFYSVEILVVVITIIKNTMKSKRILHFPRIGFKDDELLFLDDEGEKIEQKAKKKNILAIFIDSVNNFVFVDNDEDYMKVKEAYKKAVHMEIPAYTEGAKVAGKTNLFDEGMALKDMIRPLKGHTITTNRKKLDKYLVESGWQRDVIDGRLVNIYMFTPGNKQNSYSIE